jgi:tripartite-type tricarboxylate transporter receptor subunit TctC
MRLISITHKITAIMSLLLINLCASYSVRADDVSSFYQNKTVTLIVGYSAGGGYDIYARTVAHYLGAHIPGRPNVIIQNMPGAGSIASANYLYNVALKDGTVIGTFGRGVPMEPLIGFAKTQYDATKFSWIGSAANELSVCAVTQKSKIKKWDDALKMDVAVGGEGSGSDPDTYAMMVRGIFKAQFRIVTGYPGGNDMTLAIERGELDGRCGWSWGSIKATRPDWISGPNKLNVLLVMSTDRNPELPDIPSVLEKADNDNDRDIIKLIVSRQKVARPFTAPPSIPADRLAALRQAFMDTMKDKAFLDEAKSLTLEISPLSGQDVESLIKDLYASKPESVQRARDVIASGGKQ